MQLKWTTSWHKREIGQDLRATPWESKVKWRGVPYLAITRNLHYQSLKNYLILHFWSEEMLKWPSVAYYNSQLVLEVFVVIFLNQDQQVLPFLSFSAKDLFKRLRSLNLNRVDKNHDGRGSNVRNYVRLLIIQSYLVWLHMPTSSFSFPLETVVKIAGYFWKLRWTNSRLSSIFIYSWNQT